MELLPAIDLRGGKCVRLLQGDYARQVDYGDDPVGQARAFAAAGARWLHVVDLDGAKEGTQRNFGVIERLARETGLQIEVGGGIRNEQTARALLDLGIARVVLGTRALEDLGWFKELVHRAEFGERVVLGLDARGGQVATRGWLKEAELTVLEVAAQVSDWPLAAIVYTDISRDGMLEGPDVEGTRQLAKSCRVPVIASGGVGSLADIVKLSKLPIAGIIVGRALYEGKFTLEEALRQVSST